MVRKQQRKTSDAGAWPEGRSQQTTFCKHCKKSGHNSSTCTVFPDYQTDPDLGSLQKQAEQM
jgi:hypothetical protein